jgi:DNA repair protein RecO (recombination protein O)
MAGFYLNELLLKLTTRHDPHPVLFDAYHDTLMLFKQGGSLERGLRIFEKRLLDELGYGLDLAVDADLFYQFRPEQGLVPAVPDAPGALAGRSLISLANEDLGGPGELEDSRKLLQAALAHCLEGRELTTRVVARAIARREPRP